MNSTNTTVKTIYLSKRGMKEQKKAIKRLERERSRIIAGLHEQDRTNDHDGRLEKIERLAQLDSVESELQERQLLLAAAKPFPKAPRTTYAQLGSVVELIDKHGRRFVYTLVNSIEANPSDGRISVKSPLGQNLVGKSLSDTISWAGMKSNQLQLVRIS
jgi:transcription elongation factor GreA